MARPRTPETRARRSVGVQQCVGEIDTRAPRGRREPGRHRGDQSRRQPEHHDRAIESDVIQARHPGRRNRRQHAHQAPGEHEAERASCYREDGAFREQLSDDPQPAPTHCRPDRQLALSRHAARQQEARDVGARDQQHERDSDRQDRQRRAGRCGHVLDEPPGVHNGRPALSEKEVGQAVWGRCAGGRGAFRLDLRERRARRDTSERRENDRAGRGRRRSRNEVGQPDPYARIRKLERRRGHTDNHVRCAVDNDRGAENIPAGRVALAPQRVTEDGNRRGVLAIVLVRQESPEGGSHAERVQHSRRHTRAECLEALAAGNDLVVTNRVASERRRAFACDPATRHRSSGSTICCPRATNRLDALPRRERADPDSRTAAVVTEHRARSRRLPSSHPLQAQA